MRFQYIFLDFNENINLFSFSNYLHLFQVFDDYADFTIIKEDFVISSQIGY